MFSNITGFLNMKLVISSPILQCRFLKIIILNSRDKKKSTIIVNYCHSLVFSSNLCKTR